MDARQLLSQARNMLDELESRMHDGELGDRETDEDCIEAREIIERIDEYCANTA